MHDGDTLPIPMRPSSKSPYDVIGVAPGASAQAVRAAYRIRARALHPDTSSSPDPEEFQALVEAFKAIGQIKPGSLESHPLWFKLSGLDRYWSREQGYDTAELLEMWLILTNKMDDYIDEDGEERTDLDPSSLAAMQQAVARAAEDAQMADVMEAAETAETADAAEAADVADAADAAEAEMAEAAEAARATAGRNEISPAGISELLAYRVFLGNEQWRVRWAAASDGGGVGGDEAEEAISWEAYRVLDTERLRKEAERIRAASRAAPRRTHEPRVDHNP